MVKKFFSSNFFGPIPTSIYRQRIALFTWNFHRFVPTIHMHGQKLWTFQVNQSNPFQDIAVRWPRFGNLGPPFSPIFQWESLLLKNKNPIRTLHQSFEIVSILKYWTWRATHEETYPIVFPQYIRILYYIIIVPNLVMTLQVDNNIVVPKLPIYCVGFNRHIIFGPQWDIIKNNQTS